MGEPAEPDLRSATVEALEACRVEVVRRLNHLKLPLFVNIPQTAVVAGTTPGSWTTEHRVAQVSGLADGRLLTLIDDHSVPNCTLGLREQLEPLAERLAATSDLANRPAATLTPDLAGVDALIAGYLSPMAAHYLIQLSDLGRPEPELAQRIGAELESLAHFRGKRIAHTTQMGLAPVWLTPCLR